jgi:hypothetical protein
MAATKARNHTCSGHHRPVAMTPEPSWETLNVHLFVGVTSPEVPDL